MTEIDSFEQNYEKQQLFKTGEGEKLELKGNTIIGIDQFMLSNPQFRSLLNDLNDKDQIKGAVESYGGFCCEMPSGKYKVFRDPYQMVIALAPFEEGNEAGPDFDAIIDEHESMQQIGRVCIDTRCIVLIDKDLLFNKELLTRYAVLRNRGEDKKARDLLRESGAAVRYGFSPTGDELGVHYLESRQAICLWPES